MMIVNRRTFTVKKGRLQEAIQLLKTGVKAFPTLRIYVSNIGPFDQLVFDVDFENLSEYEKQMAEFGSAPETPALMEKWLDVTLEGGANEIWDLVE